MINTLIYLLILCITFGLIYYIVTLLPLPQPFKNVAIIIVVLIMVLILLGVLLGAVPLTPLVR